MPQYINQISSRKEEVGGMIPVYINAPLTRVGSGLLGNKLKYMEKLSVGSPFEYNYNMGVRKVLLSVIIVFVSEVLVSFTSKHFKILLTLVL